MPLQYNQELPCTKRRRPPPKRGRPGSKRPRTVFSLDDITTVAPPERVIDLTASFPNSTTSSMPVGGSESNGAIGTDNNDDNNNNNNNINDIDNTTASSRNIIPNESLSKVEGWNQEPTGQEDPMTMAGVEKLLASPEKKVPEIEAENQSLHQNQLELEEEQQQMASAEKEIDTGTQNSDDNDNDEEDGPWWTLAENQHGLQDWIMSKLDAMVTTAEREEERFLMNHFDEKILMHQLHHNIGKANEPNDEHNTLSTGPNDQTKYPEPAAIDREIETETETETEIDTDQSPGGEDPNEISPEQDHPKQSETCTALSTPKGMKFENDNKNKKEKKKVDSGKAKTNQNFKRPSLETRLVSLDTETDVLTSNKSQAVPSTAPANSISIIDPPGTTIIRRTLPKWIPNQSGNVSDIPMVRLFTPQEFDSFVVQPMMNKLTHNMCQIRLLDDDPGDKNSYLLEFKASDDHKTYIEAPHKRLWESLRATTNAYVRSKIADVNLQCLLQDGASLELELNLEVFEPLGVRFSRFTPENGSIVDTNQAECPPGLWINRVDHDKGLSKALGSHTAFRSGCALLTFNGIPIQDPLYLRKLLISFKAKAKASKIKTPASIKICLSKYSDLSEIPVVTLFQSFNLKRRDGKPVDVDSYAGLLGSFKSAKGPGKGHHLLSSQPPKKFVHPSFPEHLQTTSEQPQAPDAATDLVREQPESSNSKDISTANNDKDDIESQDRRRLPKTVKKIVHPSFPQNLKSPAAAVKSSSNKPTGGVVRNVSNTSTMPSKPKGAKGIPNKTPLAERTLELGISNKSSTVSMSTNTSSINISDPEIAADTKAGSQNNPSINNQKETRSSSGNTASNSKKGKTAKESLPAVNGDRQPTENAQQQFHTIPTQSNSAAELNIQKTTAEDKQILPKAVSNTSYPTNSFRENTTDVPIGTSTSTSTTSNIGNDSGNRRGKSNGNGNNDCGNSGGKGIRSDTFDADEDKGIPKASRNRTQDNNRTGASTGNTAHPKPHQKPNRSKGLPHSSDKDAVQQQRRRYSECTSSPRQKGHSVCPMSPRQKGRNDASSCFDPFEVALHPTHPLGGFFRTERGQNFKSKCVILSMYERGRLAGDKRIKIGTQVTAVMVGERRNSVKNHTDLQNHYSDAKHFRRNLRLILQNSHSCRTESNHVQLKNWSTSGAWIGDAGIGWAGGAFTNEKPTSDPRARSLSQSNGNQEASSLERSFSPKYVFSSPSTTTEDDERRQNAPPLPGEESFVDAIRNESWDGLIDVIESGPDFTKEFVQHVLKKQYIYVGYELKKLNSSSSDAETNGFRIPMRKRLELERTKQSQNQDIIDLEAKKKILKLYINSIHLIENAMTLRNWTEIEIELKFLKLFELPSKAIPGRSKVISTTIRRINPDAELRRLPVETTRHQISYCTNNKMTIHNNYNTTLHRKFAVEISEGDPKRDEVQPNQLGQFAFTLNEIEKLCPSEGKWKDIEKRSEGSGIIGLRAKRRSANKEYFASKRKEILDMIKTQLVTIERFNDEYSSSFKLTPNVRGLHGISLLYASIEIMADQQLVQKMVSLGADPQKQPGAKSRVKCSPLDLARKYYDRCKAKARDACDSSRQDRQACAQKSAEARRLLDILEAAK